MEFFKINSNYCYYKFQVRYSSFLFQNYPHTYLKLTNIYSNLITKTIPFNLSIHMESISSKISEPMMNKGNCTNRDVERQNEVGTFSRLKTLGI
jgi:hypothetical protein